MVLDTGRSITGDKVIVTTGEKASLQQDRDGSMYEVLKNMAIQYTYLSSFNSPCYKGGIC